MWRLPGGAAEFDHLVIGDIQQVRWHPLPDIPLHVRYSIQTHTHIRISRVTDHELHRLAVYPVHATAGQTMLICMFRCSEKALQVTAAKLSSS